MAITTLDQIISARCAGNGTDHFDGMSATQTPVLGAWFNTARQQKTSTPSLSYTAYTGGGTGGAVMNAATAGAVPLAYSGSNQRILTGFGGFPHATNGFLTMMLLDILWSGGPITYGNGSTVTPSTVPSLTRYNGSAAERAGNMIMVDVGTLLGGTPGTLAVNYTEQDGSTTRNTTAITPTVAAGTANRIISGGVTTGPPFIQLNAASTGVTKINSVTFGAGSSPTGSIYLNIVRPLAVVPFVIPNCYSERDAIGAMGQLIELVKGTDSQHGCLVPILLGGGTTASVASWFTRTVSG